MSTGNNVAATTVLSCWRRKIAVAADILSERVKESSPARR